MLRRKDRATRPNIEEAIKSGVTISELFLYAKVSRKDGNMAGFAIVVSKKIEKTSVGRHRIKRKISAALEANIAKMDPRFKRTVVFFPKKTEKPVPYENIRKDLQEILKKSRFYA